MSNLQTFWSKAPEEILTQVISARIRARTVLGLFTLLALAQAAICFGIVSKSTPVYYAPTGALSTHKA